MYQGRLRWEKGRRGPTRGNARVERRGGGVARTVKPGESRFGGKAMRLLTLVGLVVAGLFLGCSFFTAKQPPAPPPPAVMPMTDAAVSEILARVDAAKASQRRPESLEDYIRYTAAAYVEPIRSRYAVSETVDAAVSTAVRGDAQAGRFLAGTVRDVQLLAAMGGRTFTVEQWREIYVRSGLMTQDTFSRLGGDMPRDEATPAIVAQPETGAVPLDASGAELPPAEGDEP